MTARPLSALLPMLACVVVVACGDGSPARPSNPAPPPPGPSPLPSPEPERVTYDVERRGVPQFATANYIDLSAISDVSRFRSAAGHDYSDGFESCRSMKHYFKPARGIDAARIRVSAPVDGEIVGVRREWAGVQIAIRPHGHPAFRVILFHVNPARPVSAGTHVRAGQRLGTHIGDQTASDVAVEVDSPEGRRLVSWFDAITPEVFQAYQARGITSRARVIISRTERDAHPLTCAGETFTNRGTLKDWITLN